MDHLVHVIRFYKFMSTFLIDAQIKNLALIGQAVSEEMFENSGYIYVFSLVQLQTVLIQFRGLIVYPWSGIRRTSSTISYAFS